MPDHYICRGCKNVFDEVGLISWAEVKPKGVRDKAYLVLKKENKPKHFTEIAKLQEAGHDLKQVMSLLCTNFFTQLADGQMHANITPGNIRVTPNNQVAYLDRNFYQHFSDEDRAFLFGIMNNRSEIDQMIAHNHTI